jgi:hypothetical protein
MYVTRKKRGRKHPENNGHYIPLQRPRAAHTLCSNQLFFKCQIMSQGGKSRLLYLVAGTVQTILKVRKKNINKQGGAELRQASKSGISMSVT